jgi:Ca2+-binding RTX toxin-like protein
MRATTRQPRGRETALLALMSVALIAAVPDADARPRCAGKVATHVGSKGRDVIVVPKKGRQVIVARGGNDRIVAKRNHDVICGGPGDDVILAGNGRDRVFAGSGSDFIGTGRGADRVRGEGGNDTIRAGAGGDRLSGGPGDDSIAGHTGRDRILGGDGNDLLDGGPGGDLARGQSGADALRGDSGTDRLLGGADNDRIHGELQDDFLYGEDGDDTLIGDHGIDVINSGPGTDWMRGGTNQDSYDGGSGSDTVSLATATPPGPTGEITGVQVDLRRGIVKGDGGTDAIRGTENVLGSPYDDDIIGTGGGAVEGLLGDDECTGFSQESCDSTPSDINRTHVRLEGGPDPGLMVVPRRGATDEVVTISVAGSGHRVAGPGTFNASGGCEENAGGVSCSSAGAPLGYVVAFGGDGNDRITIGPGFPGGTTIELDGGNGNDRLEGNANHDNLYAGQFGEDVLIGNGGGDALISEAGRDILIGGSGNDNLVTSDPCHGHVFDGGSGAADVAGFGRTYYDPVVARVGGTAVKRGQRGCNPTRILKNNEVLEGTRFGDLLYGSARKDTIIGREGDDRLYGLKGADTLIGGPGKDRLFGGPGPDKCKLGPGGLRRVRC